MLDAIVNRRNLNRAADSYDEADFLAREVADRLIERLGFIHIKPLRILDCGARTGYLSQSLASYYPNAQVFALDCAEQMLLRNPCVGLVSHNEALPFEDNSMDMIVSSVSLYATNDLAACFREFQRVLKPNGLVMLTMFGVDTLKELRMSFASCQSYHMLFPDMHDIGDLLLQAGFEDPVMDMEAITIRYRQLNTLFSDFKKIGAQNAHQLRPKGLFGPHQWRHAMAQYQLQRQDGVYPATFEILYGHAWLPEKEDNELPEEVAISVQDIFNQ
jgi:malonyl-CoA O-methyltransferase